MVETPGMCMQTRTCEVARSARSVSVPLGTSFVCPECGNGLVPPVQAGPPAAPGRVPLSGPMALVGSALLVLGGAVFLGRMLGEVSRPPAPAAVPLVATAAPPAAPQAAAAGNAGAAMATDRKTVAVEAPEGKSVTPRQADTTPPSLATQPALAALPTPPQLPVVQTTPAPPASPAPTVQPEKRIAAAPEPPAARPLALPEAAPKAAPAPKPALVAALPPPPDQPFSPVPVTGGAPAYPSELVATGRPGRVTVTCQVQVDGAPTGCRAVAAKGGPAFAATTLAWLGSGHVRYRPVVLHGRVQAGQRSWTLAITAPEAVLADIRRKQAEASQQAEASAQVAAPLTAEKVVARQVLPAPDVTAPTVAAPAFAPAVADRPFSTRVLTGGAPRFPSGYDQHRSGAVTVSCVVSEGGTPSGCRVVKVSGGKAFGRSVQEWLSSGQVRFSPATVQGQPVSRQETWAVVFKPDSDGGE